MTTADWHAEPRRERRAQGLGAGVGIERQQQGPLDAIGLSADVRLIDAGIGHDETEPMLDDQYARPLPHDALRFRQDQLDEARILLDFASQLVRTRARA